jgi:hypothetical protein
MGEHEHKWQYCRHSESFQLYTLEKTSLLQCLKRQGSDERFISRYIMSDASIAYYIAVTAAKATRKPFSSVIRRKANQTEARVAMREAVVQKKKKKQDSFMSKTRCQRSVFFDAEICNHIKQPLQYIKPCTRCKVTECHHVDSRRCSSDCTDSPLGDGDAMLVGSDWRTSRRLSPMRSLANTSVA